MCVCQASNMGIPGLLLALKDITKKKHIREYADMTVGVDVSCWLHKGVYSCSEKLCKGEPTTQYVDYCIKCIRALQMHHITPLIVFDGGLLPAKEATESERREKRSTALKQALEYDRKGDKTMARQHFVRAVDVTPWMCRKLMDRLDKMAVSYVVAPYEADAQLAYLFRTGQVDVVMTEDSDLLPYGCEKVMYKWDKDSGMGDEIDLRHAMLNSRKLNMQNWTRDQFLVMCIFAGCDYLSSLKGVAITKAYHLVNKYKTPRRILRQIRFEAKSIIPAEYLANFESAMLTFRHARVWDPRAECLVYLTDIAKELDPEKLDFLGPTIPRDIARKVCQGVIDPITRAPFAPGACANAKCAPTLCESTGGGGSSKHKRIQMHSSSRQHYSSCEARNMFHDDISLPIYKAETNDCAPRGLARKRYRQSMPATPFEHLRRTHATKQPFKAPRISVSPQTTEVREASRETKRSSYFLKEHCNSSLNPEESLEEKSRHSALRCEPNESEERYESNVRRIQPKFDDCIPRERETHRNLTEHTHANENDFSRKNQFHLFHSRRIGQDFRPLAQYAVNRPHAALSPSSIFGFQEDGSQVNDSLASDSSKKRESVVHGGGSNNIFSPYLASKRFPAANVYLNQTFVAETPERVSSQKGHYP